MIWVISFCLLLIVILVIEGIILNLRIRKNPELQRIRRVLKSLSAEAYKKEIVSIMHKRTLSSIPWLNQGLLSIKEHIPLLNRIDHILMQADVTFPLGVYILLSSVMALGGFVVVHLLTKKLVFALSACAFSGMIPFILIYMKKNRRMKKFEQQLPDALDMIARALRAGHAFSAGIKMVASEFDDPIGNEFEITIGQINFGVSLKDALKSLAKRIDCPDLKFFAISIIIQNQTGGNLAEILESISKLIRERFKLRNHIKALAGEGKLSALILIALPFFIALTLSVISPGYIGVLLTDPLGKKLVTGAIIMMFLGCLVMKKIISIEV